jgi:hypothetical protein
MAGVSNEYPGETEIIVAMMAETEERICQEEAA